MGRTFSRQAAACLLLAWTMAWLTGLGSTSATAQSFTNSKALCLGDPPGVATAGSCTSSNGTTNPSANVPVYFAVVVNAGTAPFLIHENLPQGFHQLGVSCTAPGANGLGLVSNAGYSGIATSNGYEMKIGAFTFTTPGAMQCFIRGYFDTPGANVINQVQIIDPANHTLSSPFQLAVDVKPATAFPSDISVTKSATWEDMPLPVDVSLFAQWIDYKIIVKNNGPVAVYLGQAFRLQDFVNASSTGVPLQAFIDSSTIQCVPSGGGDCVVPGTSAGGTALTNPPLNLQNWSFPTSGAGSNGYLPVGGYMTITYRVKVQRHPDLFCAKGQEALHNEARIVYNNVTGVNFPDPVPANNVSQSVDVPVNTGQPIDPSCALPNAGPITIAKQQLPAVSGAPPYAWGSNVPYVITVKNSAPNPITVRLRDRAMPWWGTPNFSATVGPWSCTPSSACVGSPTVTSPQTFNTYALAQTVWDDATVTIPGAVNGQPGVVTLDIVLKYDVLNLCDSFANGDNQIWNEGRADYVYQGQVYVSEAEAPTIMAPVTPQCQFDVHKHVVNVDKVIYGQPISYVVNFRNSGAQAVQVGSLFDAMRFQQSNYATQIGYTGTYSCEVAGSVSGGNFPIFPTTANLTGQIYFTPQPSQGTRIFQNNGVVTFGANSEMKCSVTLTFQRPQPDDPFCLSSVEPRLENFAVMDVSQFYNPYTPFPPSLTYDPNISPVTTQQPQMGTASSWRMVDVKLPKCYKLNVNKYATPNFSWTPGGPSPIQYTIVATNAGDTLTWHDFRLTDDFTSGYGTPPALANIHAPNAGAGCLGLSGSNASSGATFSYGIGNFPAPCTISPTFTVDIPSTPGQICNRAAIRVEPNSGTGTDTDDWYANNPNLALITRNLCTPILDTVPVNVKKAVDNQAGAVLPPNFLYPIDVVCTTPNPNGPGFTPPFVTTTYHLHVADGGQQTIAHVPVTSTCVFSELTAQLPTLTTSNCPAPSTPQWTASPTYIPSSSVPISTSGPGSVGVQNTIKCVMPPVKTVTVTKVLQPATLTTTLPPATKFPVTVNCSPSPSTTLYLTPASLTQTIANVPVGATCVVTEDAPSGFDPPAHCKWAPVEIAPAHFAVLATGAAPAVTVTNKLDCDPDLSVTKSGPVPDPNIPGAVDFTITVTSVGGPFVAAPNSISVSDVTYGGYGQVLSASASPALDWSACPGPSFACTYIGPGPTSVGQTLGVITIRYRPYTAAPYLNCAYLSVVPHHGESDWNSANDSSCVNVGNLPLIDLKVVKTGPQPSGQAGVAQFTIQVINNGAPFTLPAGTTLQMQDLAPNVPGGFMNRSWTPGWTCPFSATSVTCSFTSAGMSVTTGQVLGSFQVYYHPDALTVFNNCATVAFLPAAALVDVNPTNNQSCVTAAPIIVVKDKKSDPIEGGGATDTGSTPLRCDPTVTKPSAEGCACLYEGMKATSPTTCACPAGTTLREGAGCEPNKPPPAKCDPATTTPSPEGCACLYKGMKATSPTACTCPAGSTLREGAGCEANKPPPAKCDPATATPSPEGCACLYKGMKATSPTACACPAGTALREGAGCEPDKRCPAGMTRPTPDGACACPAGTVLKGEECVKHAAACSPPLIETSPGKCQCPPGAKPQGEACVGAK